MSEIPHNERLEFLGDAVIEFLSSVHLFFMFPWLEEGGLSTYRTAIVQNQHLAVLAKVSVGRVVCLFVGWLLNVPATCDRSAQTILRAATLR